MSSGGNEGESESLIGLDLGTTGVKALLCDVQGNILASSFQDYPIFHPQPSWAEQAPNVWWIKVQEAIRELIRTSNVNPANIACLGIGSQMDGAVLIDKEGTPLRPAIIWMDRRATRQCDWIKQRINDEELYSITGLCLDPSHSAAKILWIRDNQPEIFREAHNFLLPGDFIVFKLTGELVTDYSNASCTMLFDIKAKQWSEKLCKLLEIPIEMLPSVVPSTKVVGEISTESANMTGLHKGTLIVAGGGDEEVGSVGAGVIEQGDVLDITGTAEPICISIKKPMFDPERILECHAHADPGTWILENTGIVAGGVYRWFRDHFGQIEVEASRKLNLDPYEILNLEASKVKPGSEGLICLPFFMGSITPEWNPYARGAFFGITLSHQKEHFIRAILEGCAFALRDTIDRAEKLGLKINEIKTAGGGARGLLWRQIKADITNKKTVRLAVEEVTAFGAVILAGVGVSIYKSIKQAVSEMVKQVDELYPRKEFRKRYDDLYKIYRKLYFSLKDTFIDITKYQETMTKV